MAGTAGRKALIKVSGTGASLTNEACTDGGDDLNYQITSTSKRVLDPTATITVKVGGSSVSSSTYTLNRLIGKVTFLTTASRVVTISGTYLPMSTAAECKQYSYSIRAENLDDSSFGDTWRTFVQGLKSIAGSLGRWFSTDTYFYDALTGGSLVVMEVYTDSSGSFDFRAWVRLDSDAVQSAVAGLVDESVAFTGCTDADNRSVSTP